MSPEDESQCARHAQELADELTDILKKGLAKTFKGPSRMDERKFNITAQEIRRIAPAIWEEDPPNALTVVIRIALGRLPEGAPQDSALRWVELGRILFGFADEDILPADDAWYDQVVKLLLTYYNEGPDQSDQGITPRLCAPQRIGGERWKLGWQVEVGEGSANPGVVVNLKRPDAVLTYIHGSAVWRHNVAPPGEPEDIDQETIPDATILVPTRPLETLHWGDSHATTITALFRVQIPGVRIVIQAQSPTNGNWLQELYVLPKARLSVAITVQNVGNTNLYGVVAGVNLPPHLSYVPGSTVLATDLEDTGKGLPHSVASRVHDVPDGPATTRGGVNVGTLTPGQEVVIRFVIQLDTGAGADMRAVGFVSATGHNEYYNTVVIYTEPSS